jgi:hypothetical protein
MRNQERVASIGEGGTRACAAFFLGAQTCSGGHCPPCPYPLVAAQHWQRIASATPTAVRLLLVPIGVGVGIGIDSDCVLWLVLTRRAVSKSHLLSFDSDSDTDPDTDYDPHRDRDVLTRSGRVYPVLKICPNTSGGHCPLYRLIGTSEPGDRCLKKVVLVMRRAHAVIAALLDDQLFGIGGAFKNMPGMRRRHDFIQFSMHNQDVA